ncbi:hypothetical protein CRE_27698 [Caenorhabditis remanei]|uniref:Protein kinase domain-containing protein n=1 Tax=Caenorhabditis remanei TaxID=31234 RepID=E3MKK8_CAERE|nr:hypothetical protein CRE_27698 [Caenorhabditis remanei]
MAFEMLRKVPDDHSADIWNLEVFLYDMLVGPLPLIGNLQQEINDKIKREAIYYPQKLTAYCKAVIRSF